MTHIAIISLGSNIDKEHNLIRAMEMLAAGADVIGVSSVYETVPRGLREQDNFLNAAVKIRTPLTPDELKQGLLEPIEQQLDRVRVADKNAPRTIDLDISWFDDACFEYAGSDGKVRHIPDPDMRQFAHVAVPVAELLTSDVVYPGTDETIQSIGEQLLRTATTNGDPLIWKRPDLDLSQFAPPSGSDQLIL